MSGSYIILYRVDQHGDLQVLIMRCFTGLRYVNPANRELEEAFINDFHPSGGNKTIAEITAEIAALEPDVLADHPGLAHPLRVKHVSFLKNGRLNTGFVFISENNDINHCSPNLIGIRQFINYPHPHLNFTNFPGGNSDDRAKDSANPPAGGDIGIGKGNTIGTRWGDDPTDANTVEPRWTLMRELLEELNIDFSICDLSFFQRILRTSTINSLPNSLPNSLTIYNKTKTNHCFFVDLNSILRDRRISNEEKAELLTKIDTTAIRSRIDPSRSFGPNQIELSEDYRLEWIDARELINPPAAPAVDDHVSLRSKFTGPRNGNGGAIRVLRELIGYARSGSLAAYASINPADYPHAPATKKIRPSQPSSRAQPSSLSLYSSLAQPSSRVGIVEPILPDHTVLIPATADGNCLFYAILHSLKHAISRNIIPDINFNGNRISTYTEDTFMQTIREYVRSLHQNHRQYLLRRLLTAVNQSTPLLDPSSPDSLIHYLQDIDTILGSIFQNGIYAEGPAIYFINQLLGINIVAFSNGNNHNSHNYHIVNPETGIEVNVAIVFNDVNHFDGLTSDIYNNPVFATFNNTPAPPLGNITNLMQIFGNGNYVDNIITHFDQLAPLGTPSPLCATVAAAVASAASAASAVPVVSAASAVPVPVVSAASAVPVPVVSAASAAPAAPAASAASAASAATSIYELVYNQLVAIQGHGRNVFRMPFATFNDFRELIRQETFRTTDRNQRISDFISRNYPNPREIYESLRNSIRRDATNQFTNDIVIRFLCELLNCQIQVTDTTGQINIYAPIGQLFDYNLLLPLLNINIDLRQLQNPRKRPLTPSTPGGNKYLKYKTKYLNLKKQLKEMNLL